MALYNSAFPTGTELGLKDKHKFAWLACPQCGEERWVRWNKKRREEQFYPICNFCRGHNLNYKGGRFKVDGYIRILLRPDDFFYSMTDYKGYVFEHRLVMAKYLGRNLHSWELVHHKNHIRDDNRIENLQLISSDRHNQLTLMETRITKLETKVEEQSKQIRLLKWQLKESQEEVHHRSV